MKTELRSLSLAVAAPEQSTGQPLVPGFTRAAASERQEGGKKGGRRVASGAVGAHNSCHWLCVKPSKLAR
jgi:hypothetical protein